MKMSNSSQSQVRGWQDPLHQALMADVIIHEERNLSMAKMERIIGENTDVMGAVVNGSMDTDADGVGVGHWLQFPPVSRTAHLTMAALAGIIMIVAVVGNSTVIGVVLRFKTLRTPGNILIANLALSDMLMVVFGCPMMIVSSIHGQWVFGEFGCQLYGATGTIFGLMSINTLVFISAERYFSIVHPERSRKFTNRNVYCYLVSIWVYSMLWGLLPFFGWGQYTIEGFGTTCSIDYLTSDITDRYLLLGMFLCDFLVPILAITFFYVKIYASVVQHRQLYGDVLAQESPRCNKQFKFRADWKRGGSCLSQASCSSVVSSVHYRSWSKTEYKITRTIIMVILLFCISWMPYAVVTMIGQYGDQGLITPLASMVPVLFAKASTIYNPIIYFLSHPRFRSKIKGVFPWFLCFGKKLLSCWPQSKAAFTRRTGSCRTFVPSDTESKVSLSHGSRSSLKNSVPTFPLIKLQNEWSIAKRDSEVVNSNSYESSNSNMGDFHAGSQMDISSLKSSPAKNWTDRVSREAVWKGSNQRAYIPLPILEVQKDSKAISSESLTEIDMMAIALEMRSLLTSSKSMTVPQ